MDLKKVLEEDKVIALTVMLANGVGVVIIDKVEQEYQLMCGDVVLVDCFSIHFIPTNGEDFSVEYIALDVDGVLDTLETLEKGLVP